MMFVAQMSTFGGGGLRRTSTWPSSTSVEQQRRTASGRAATGGEAVGAWVRAIYRERSTNWNELRVGQCR